MRKDKAIQCPTQYLMGILCSWNIGNKRRTKRNISRDKKIFA